MIIKRIQLLKSYKALKASSLIESVIAITIISVCLLIALAIYINVVSLNKSFNYYQAKQTVERLHQESIMNKDFDDNNFKFEGYIIKKNVSIDRETHTALIKYTIEDQKHTHVCTKLIPYNED